METLNYFIIKRLTTRKRNTKPQNKSQHTTMYIKKQAIQ